MGDSPFGDVPEDLSIAGSNLSKFSVILTIPKVDFHEFQVRFESSSQDYQFSILRHGPAVQISKYQDLRIKQ